MKRRKQNHKISFQFFAAPPCTPRRFKRKGKEIFGFGLRLEGARGADCQHYHKIRAYDLVQSHHALRALQVNQNPADFVHTLFELRPRNTANSNRRKADFVLSGDEVIIWEIITGGFETVASYFVKIATTCTEHVMFESSPLRSEYLVSAWPGYPYFRGYISY